MLYEEVQGVSIPKIGFGTWRIGGDSRPDHNRDRIALRAFHSALELGYRHFDTAEYYAHGHCEELLGQAIRDTRLDRSTLLITSKVSPENLTAQGVSEACQRSLARLGMDYLDLYLIHWPNPSVPLQDTFLGLNALVSKGVVRYLGVSNFDLQLLRQAVALSDSPILTNQVPLSLTERRYVKNGVLQYCQDKGILITAYSPIKHPGLRSDGALSSLASTKGVSAAQISLAWLCSHKGVVTIPMSLNPAHQLENLLAADLVLTDSELDLLR